MKKCLTNILEMLPNYFLKHYHCTMQVKSTSLKQFQ